MPSANEIRQQFIDFFVKKHGHTFVPSSSVVPHDDPTLMFTNAGMNQFKDVFLGVGTRPYKRAVDTQKCIRAGGKHNDLDDVGKDTYHHTFFEMLGNWSFGDYFKKEAIAWAWELLTEVWKLDKNRLHATVFQGDPEEHLEPDNEAAELWRTVTDIDPSHIHLGNKKDNFWEMGESGPCGPCSEISIDRTPDKSGGKLVNAGHPEVIEIWNLVFIQFNRGTDGKLTPLPAKHVDTGMGFERVCAVLQGKSSNYDTDVFSPIFASIQRVTGARTYGGKLDDLVDIAYRVVADHIRTLTIALADGAEISNEGRGYVLRRILRRAERYGRQYLGATKPFLCDLSASVADVLGTVFPDTVRNLSRLTAEIGAEEESFIRTLDRGIRLFQEAADRARKKKDNRISGADAFALHDTYGLFIDISEQMAGEMGLSVDRHEYEKLMEGAKQKARGARKKFAVSAVTGDLPSTDDTAKYGGPELPGCRILGWLQDDQVSTSGRLVAGAEAGLLLDRTNFYAEQGGQVGDTGTISSATGRFVVEDCQKLGDTVLHVGHVSEGYFETGAQANLQVGPLRSDTMRNHTATHLLNWALRKVLGEHVEQKGSLVDAEKTRFDFAHSKPLSSDEITRIERLVNEKVYSDLPVSAVTMPLAQARTIPGVRAVFGEKYPDPVRVLLIGPDAVDQASADDSVEFCGGIHLRHSGQAGFFKIISQEAVGKGIRRVTAVTGAGAVAAVQEMARLVEDVSNRFNCKPEEMAARVDDLQQEVKKLQQQSRQGAAGDLQVAADRLLENAILVNGTKVILGQVPSSPTEQIRQQLDRLRQKAVSAFIVLGWAEEKKGQIMAAVTEDLVKKGGHAGKLVGQVAQVMGGTGGGKPTMAQAGGKEPEKLGEALDFARKLIAEQMNH